MTGKRTKSAVLSGRAQFDALSSPLRLEILGHLTDPDGASIAEVAERMRRPAASLYYQFRVLERSGLIVAAGRRATGGRDQVLYRPAAERFAVPSGATDSSGRNLAARTLRSAHRMAERDLSAALADGARTGGEDRNCYVARLHFAAPPEVLAKINRHLLALERIIERQGRRREAPGVQEEHLSLTVALLPLQGAALAAATGIPVTEEVVSLAWVDHLWVAFLVGIVPLLAIRERRRLELSSASGEPGTRTRTYRRTILGQWPVAAAVTATWLALGRGLAELGLGAPAHAGFWWGGAAALAVGVALVLQMRWIAGDAKRLDEVRARFDSMREMMPTNVREARWCDAVAFTASVCEEVVYRGFLLAYFVALAGTLGGVALASLAFGFAHAYQGARGLASTAMVGAVAAGFALWTGALWAPMLLHFLLDWTSVRIGRLAVARPAAEAA